MHDGPKNWFGGLRFYENFSDKESPIPPLLQFEGSNTPAPPSARVPTVNADLARRRDALCEALDAAPGRGGGGMPLLIAFSHGLAFFGTQWFKHRPRLKRNQRKLLRDILSCDSGGRDPLYHLRSGSTPHFMPMANPLVYVHVPSRHHITRAKV